MSLQTTFPMTINRYFELRHNAFKWRYNLTAANKVIFALMMAAVTGLSAQIVIPLPWTPVPITGQTFAVLLSGILLGGRYGALSQIFYLGIGSLGVPWFAGAAGGYLTLVDPSGGYLLGFIFASAFLGYFSDKYPKMRNFFPMICLMFLASAIIFATGVLQLKMWLSYSGMTSGIWTLLQMGVIPFIIGDIFKIFFSAALATFLAPKTAFK